MIRSLSCFFLILSTGCSGADPIGNLVDGGSTLSGAADWNVLFQAPTGNATSDDIHGLWGGTATLAGTKLDFRFRIDVNRTQVATRCKYNDGTELMAGVAAATRLESSALTFLESKNSEVKKNALTCSVNVAPRTLKFELSGTNLTFEPFTVDEIRLVKLSD